MTSEIFDCQEAWFPVFFERDLDKRHPQGFVLLGVPIVLWWDGQWNAFTDRCPHRLASLSEGRINEQGNLECPYHGWSFHRSGQCQQIPQQLPGGDAHTSKRACATVHATAVKQGLVFVYGKPGVDADPGLIPIVPDIEDKDWVCIDTSRDLPYDAFTLLENVLDSSHLPYTHHRSVGNRANAAPVELEVLESGRSGFVGFWAEGPRRGKLGSQTTKFIAPNLMWHDLTSKQFGRTLTVVYATPIEKGKCRVFARFPFKFPSALPRLVFRLTPRWLSHLGQNAILEDDQIFLHNQERYFESLGGSPSVSKAFYLPTKADLFVLEFHKWLDRYGVDPFPGQSLPPRLTKDQLFDRYNSHTIHCASCRGALQNIDRIRAVCLSFIIISLLAEIIFSAKIVTVTIGLLSFVLWLGLGKLRSKFYEGRATPPRNMDDRKTVTTARLD